MTAVKNNLTDACAAAASKMSNFTSCCSDVVVTDEPNKAMSDVIDVLIAGAGIGGLITALCLRRAGFSVRLHERAQILESIGFGLHLQPYCVKVLYELGLEREMNEVGVCICKAAFYSRNGQFVYQEPQGIDAGFNWPMYSVHRGHFQQLLLHHVRTEVGETSIRLSQKLVAFRSKPNHVEVDFVNPTTGERTTELAKVLVGADGINSTVRKILYPDEGLALCRGLTVWRGVTRTDKVFLDGQSVIYMGNPDECLVVVYPVSSNLVNWVCVIRTQDLKAGPSSVTPNWNNLGHVQDLLPLLSTIKLDFLDIHDLIISSIVVNQFPMSDRDTLPRWTHDRVTLLGDAAHPMYPNGGNGASQAILDARALVLSFREHGVTSKGLKAYDDFRRPAAHDFVLLAREYGTDKILKIVDERSPLDFRHLSDVISPSEIEANLPNCQRLSSYNAQQLNQEPPLFEWCQ